MDKGSRRYLRWRKHLDYGARRNLAYAFVDPDCADVGTALKVDVMGLPQDAVVIAPSPYDPEHRLVR